jgi:hypothetical protein
MWPPSKGWPSFGRRTPRHALRWRPAGRGGLDGFGRPQRCMPQRATDEHGEDQPTGHGGRTAKDAFTGGVVLGIEW